MGIAHPAIKMNQMQKEEIIFQGGVGMKNKRPLVKWTWSQMIAGISTGKIDGHEFMATVEKIRKSIFKSESAKNLKSTLPFIFPSVTLVDGADIGSQEIVHHNGFCQIDIDYDEMTDMPGRMNRAMEIKKKLLGDPYIVLMFLSPQWGVKILCRIPADRHEHDRHYRGLVSYFKEKYGLTHDPACVGIKRLIFLAYDPVPYHNQHAIMFELPREVADSLNNRVDTPVPPQTKNVEVTNAPSASSSKTDNELQLDLEYCIASITKDGTDITSVHSEWHSIGMSLASLGESGRSYFHAVSKNYPKYTQEETNKEFDYCLKTSNGSIKIATFFYYCKKYSVGLRPKKSAQEPAPKKAGSQSETAILSETPVFDQSIYESLPPPLKELCSLFSHERSRDMLLASMLAIAGPTLHKVYGLYSGQRVYPTLFIFIVAPPASNKSVVNWSRRLGSLIEGYLAGLSQVQAEAHAADGGHEKAKQAPVMFFVPANSSAAGLIQLLGGLESGIIFETEADTMAAIVDTDFGNYIHTLRDIFDHVEVKQYRKTDKEYSHIEHPKLSVLLTGTPNQLFRLMKDGNSGIHSRFIFYGFEDKPIYVSPFAQGNEHLADYFNQGAKEMFELYNYLRDKEEIRFSLTPEQITYFDKLIGRWQSQSHWSHGNIGASITTRLGVILFKVAMILTAIRTKCKTELICSDDDFRTAIKLTESFRVHSLSIVTTFPVSPTPVAAEGKLIERFFEALPSSFTSKDAVAMHKTFGVSDRTIQRYLKKFREDGRLSEVNGHYSKR